MDKPTIYGVEQTPLGFRWFDGTTRGEPTTTLVAVHVDAIRSGRTHGGVAVDRMLGADLWRSYLAACAILDIKPEPTAHNPTMRVTCFTAALLIAKGPLQ